MDRKVHGNLHRARDDPGHVRPAAGARRGDVQPGGAGTERWGCVHGDTESGTMKFVLAAALLAMPLIWIALPLPQGLTAPPVVASVTLEDRNGLVLRSTRSGDGSLQRWLSLGEIDPDVLETFVASEDRRFYEHHGV